MKIGGLLLLETLPSRLQPYGADKTGWFHGEHRAMDPAQASFAVRLMA